MQFRGELKQRWGKFIDNDLQQIEGSFDKIIGVLQEQYGGNCVSLVREQYGERKEELMKRADQWHQRSQPEIHERKDALKGSHQEDTDHRVSSHFR